MKHFLATLLTFSILTFALPQKEAKAGVAIFVVGTPIGIILDNHEMAGLEGIVFGGLVGIPGVLIGAGVSLFMNATIGTKIIKWSLILDSDASLEQNHIERGLTEQYSFIDNQSVIQQLAGTIKSKYQADKRNTYVVLAEEETRSILGSANLSDGEIEQVVNDLK